MIAGAIRGVKARESKRGSWTKSVPSAVADGSTYRTRNQ